MKKVIIAVLILVVAFLVYSFAPTGYSILDKDTVIEVTPTEIKPGQTVEVTITPGGTRGIDREMALIKRGGNLKKDTTDAWGTDCANSGRGSTKRCKVTWTFNYKFPGIGLPEGDYYLRFYDYDKEEFIRSQYIAVTE